jgi:hypothetical protein
MRKVIAASLLVALLGAGLPAEGATFKNCTELRKTYANGVSKSKTTKNIGAGPINTPKVSAAVYGKNLKLDTDRDGIVCEVIKPKRVSDPPAETVSIEPNAGRLCPVEGEIKSMVDRLHTCVKLGAELRWSQGKIDHSYVYSTDQGFEFSKASHCRIDRDAPEEWFALQTLFASLPYGCPPSYRILEYRLGEKRPSTAASKVSESAGICKLQGPSNWLKGFGDDRRRKDFNVLGRNAIVQVIPIYAPDTAKPSNSPAVDYQKYLTFVEKFVRQTSDKPSQFRFRVPEKYFEFSKALKPFGLSHESKGPMTSLMNEILGQVDSQIDFTGATTAIVVVPAGTDLDVWQQGPLAGALNTQEGRIFSVSSVYPNTEELRVQPPKFMNLMQPAWWIHEFFHIGVGLDDHYGDDDRGLSQRGMGAWGMMSPSSAELLTWHKWLLDYIDDSQVTCVQSPSERQVIWLSPSSAKSTETKLAVLKISDKRAIAIESVRAAGLNHRLTAKDQGALVYEVDLSQTSHGYGFNALTTIERSLVASGSFAKSEFPLKLGEYVDFGGYRIKVIETGTFGDVIEVSTAG